MNIRKFFQENKVIISLEDDCHSYAQRTFSSGEDADAAIYLLQRWIDETFYRGTYKVIVGTENRHQ